MESSATPPDSASVDDLFEVTMRGYNRRQVEDFVAKARAHVENLTAELGGTRQQRDQLMRDLTLLQEELLNVRQQLESRPAHEEISSRMAQILRLAQEEADQERQKADAETQEMVERAQAEAGETVERARAEAAELLASTRISAEQTIQAAQDQAMVLLQEAGQKAEFAVQDATLRAQRLLGNAEQRTNQIVEVQDERVSTLVAVHTEAVRRLAEILDVLGGVIDQEEVAGPLELSFDSVPLPVAGPPLRPDEVEGLACEPETVEGTPATDDAEQAGAAALASAAEAVGTVSPGETEAGPAQAVGLDDSSDLAEQDPAVRSLTQAPDPRTDTAGEALTAPSGTGPHLVPGDMDATMLISLPSEDGNASPPAADHGSGQQAVAESADGGLFLATAATEVLRPSPDDGTITRPSASVAGTGMNLDGSDPSTPPTGPR